MTIHSKTAMFFLSCLLCLVCAACGEKGGTIVIKNESAEDVEFYFEAQGKDTKSLIVGAGKEGFKDFDYDGDIRVTPPGDVSVSLSDGKFIVLSWDGEVLTLDANR